MTQIRKTSFYNAVVTWHQP